MFTKKLFWQKKTTWLTFLGLLVAGAVFTVFYAQSPWFIAAVVFAGFITGIAVIAIAGSRNKATVGDAVHSDAGHRNQARL